MLEPTFSILIGNYSVIQVASDSTSRNLVDHAPPLHYAKSMKVSAQYVQEHFADILNTASGGEEIEIAVPGKPALFLATRIATRQSTPSGRPRRELLYAGEGMVTAPTDEEWRRMDREIEDEMLNGPIFPQDQA
jgi:antitoxin (DNA-binding transcriptional repressor) of toxin-antitoxin stability system